MTPKQALGQALRAWWGGQVEPPRDWDSLGWDDEAAAILDALPEADTDHQHIGPHCKPCLVAGAQQERERLLKLVGEYDSWIEDSVRQSLADPEPAP